MREAKTSLPSAGVCGGFGGGGGGGGGVVAGNRVAVDAGAVVVVGPLGSSMQNQLPPTISYRYWKPLRHEALPSGWPHPS